MNSLIDYVYFYIVIYILKEESLVFICAMKGSSTKKAWFLYVQCKEVPQRKLGFFVSLLDVNYLFISTLISKTIREKCCHTEPCKKEEC